MSNVNLSLAGRPEAAAAIAACTTPPAWAGPLRVFVALGEHAIYKRGLAAVLAQEPGLQWHGEAADGAEALRLAPALAPDVVLFDPAGVRTDDADVLCRLRTLLPTTGFLLVGQRPGWASADAPGTAAEAVLPYRATAQELVQAVQAAAHAGKAAPWARPTAGCTTCDAAAAGDLPAQPGMAGLQAAASVAPPPAAEQPAPRRVGPGADLTPRERELLAQMARGLTNQDISDQLGIAIPTVKFHVTNILGKLQVENRTSAVLIALRHRIIDLT